MAGWTHFSRSLEAWLNSLWSTIHFHGTSSRSFSAIPASSAVCRCLQVHLLSKNHPGLECSPSGASGGWVIGGVQAASAITLVTSPRHVYILHELCFCTCSCLSSFMHYLCIACSAIAVHCDYRVVRHPLEDIATYWTRTRTLKGPYKRPPVKCELWKCEWVFWKLKCEPARDWSAIFRLTRSLPDMTAFTHSWNFLAYGKLHDMYTHRLYFLGLPVKCTILFINYNTVEIKA